MPGVREEYREGTAYYRLKPEEDQAELLLYEY